MKTLAIVLGIWVVLSLISCFIIARILVRLSRDS